jgi:hypothetical protein
MKHHTILARNSDMEKDLPKASIDFTFEGEDTSPVTKEELKGFYSYPVAVPNC